MPSISMMVDRLRNLVMWATLASLGLAACACVALPEYCRTSASVDEMVIAEAAMGRGRAPAPIAQKIEVTLATGGEDAGGLVMWSWE
jgi:hypothetical protein